jgi:hypothetical protein
MEKPGFKPFSEPQIGLFPQVNTDVQPEIATIVNQ